MNAPWIDRPARRGALRLSLALALSCVSAGAFAQSPEPGRYADVDAARLVSADEEPGQWMAPGRTYWEQHHSPLDQINTENIGRLGLTWFADFDTNRGQEATPIVVDGVIYVTTAWSKVYAFDGKSGELLWRYDPEVPGEWAPRVCCDFVNRGAAVWDGKVFVGTIDGRLVALDAATGAEVWDVNTIDRTKPYAITGAPRVVKGRVLIGNAGGEFGVRGYISAYDAQTGEMAWRFYTVPGNPADGFENEAMEMAAATWTGEWWELGGGGTVWDSMSYDPELDLLYVGVGNGAPWNQAYRSPGGGDNLFLSSIVALDPDDGSYVWHYQEAPGESWDYPATQPIVVADLDFDGATRRVVMQAPKNGFFYVLDAATGALISADPFTTVNWATGVDLATGRPIEVPEARYYLTGEPFIMQPGAQGAHSWHPMAYAPETGLVYLGVVENSFVYAHPESFEPAEQAANLGLDFAALADPSIYDRLGSTAQRQPRAFLQAWDPIRRREVWRSDYNGDVGGGVLSTAGGLVFHGASTGELAAYRASDGEKLWSMNAQTGVVAGAASYEIDGEQYIAQVAGFGSGGYGQSNQSRLLVFKLGGTAVLPPEPPAPPPPVLDPPPMTAPPETVAAGLEVYERHCAVCHDASRRNTGLFPDLRYTAALKDADLFRAIVLEGVLSANGMASFAPVLDEADAEAARAYLISRAHQATPPPASEAENAATDAN